MKTEVIVTNEFTRTQVVLHPHETPNEIARFAFSLIERWGLVAGKQDGEDSAGRAKVGYLPVEEMTTRAFDAAESAYKVARERGLMVDVPDWEKIREMARAERERN